MSTGVASPGAAFAFSTERLRIQPLEESDELLYCGLYTDPETMRFIGPTLTAEAAALSFQTALRINRRQPLRQLFLTLAHRTSLQPVGMCSVRGIDVARRRAEAGIIITSAARAHGFATEGLRALVARAFQALPIDEIWMQTAAGHIIVERMALRVGFAPGGAVAPTKERPGQRLWSAWRQSWF